MKAFLFSAIMVQRFSVFLHETSIIFYDLFLMTSFFISGTGTGVGKTLVAAIVTEALHADYWKPVQAGNLKNTDAMLVKELVSNKTSFILPECYKFKMAASPHLAAAAEDDNVDLANIQQAFKKYSAIRRLVVEGAGGILAPVNNSQFSIDLLKHLNIPLILVSHNTLGSINHSLLTASVCRQNNVPVAGWIFTGSFMNYEDDIVRWSGYRKLASIPFTHQINKTFVLKQADVLKQAMNGLYD